MTSATIPVMFLAEQAANAILLGEDTLSLLTDIEYGLDGTCPYCGGMAPESYPAIAPRVGHMRGCALRAMLEAYLAIHPEKCPHDNTITACDDPPTCEDCGAELPDDAWRMAQEEKGEGACLS